MSGKEPVYLSVEIRNDMSPEVGAMDCLEQVLRHFQEHAYLGKSELVRIAVWFKEKYGAEEGIRFIHDPTAPTQ